MSDLIAIIGPRRSGLHAIVNWLIAHHPGRVRFINDPAIDLPPKPEFLAGCFQDYRVHDEGIIKIPSMRPIRITTLTQVYAAGTLPWPLNAVARRLVKNLWVPAYEGVLCFARKVDRTGKLPADMHVLLFENLSPAEAARVLPGWLAAYRDRYGLPPVDRERLFIVLRSPWNHLASTLKCPQPTPPRPVAAEHVTELWADYAQELVGETAHLDPARWETRPIIYDHWLTSPSLRAAIAAELGRPPTDLGLGQIADFGGGSSFVGKRGAPCSPADLTNRWRHYQDHPLMQSLLSSDKIRRLASSLEINMPDPVPRET